MGLLVLTCVALFHSLQFLIAQSKTGGGNGLGTRLYMYMCLIMLCMRISPSNGMASGESTCSSMEIAKSTQSGRPRESSAWDYFIYDGEKHKSICQIGFDQEGSPPCNTEIAGKYATNLKAHLTLKAKHPRELAELAKKDAEKEKTKELKRKSQDGASFSATAQLTIVDAVARTKKYTRESERYQRIMKKLATFICVGNMANRIVECAEFRSLLAELDERYPVPGHATITSEMDKLLIDLKGNLMSRLNDARKVALCVDIWSRKGLTASYLGITAHFFTRSDHKRHTATIAVRRLPSPHTAERVEEIVDNVLTEWQIP